MSPRQAGPKAAVTDIETAVVLRLYIAGGAPNSAQAVANIKHICHEHLRGAYKLQVIDVLEHPRRAMNAGILVTPTLIKLSPPPVEQIVGNLSDTEKVLLAIGIIR